MKKALQTKAPILLSAPITIKFGLTREGMNVYG